MNTNSPSGGRRPEKEKWNHVDIWFYRILVNEFHQPIEEEEGEGKKLN